MLTSSPKTVKILSSQEVRRRRRLSSLRLFLFPDIVGEPWLEDRLFDLLAALFVRLVYDLLKWIVAKLREWLRRKP